MILSHHENSSAADRSPTAFEEGRNAWLAEQTAGLLYRDNLIYLPFAAHLSDEDVQAESFAKAA